MVIVVVCVVDYREVSAYVYNHLRSKLARTVQLMNCSKKNLAPPADGVHHDTELQLMKCLPKLPSSPMTNQRLWRVTWE